jgi:hypothetical protein
MADIEIVIEAVAKNIAVLDSVNKKLDTLSKKQGEAAAEAKKTQGAQNALAGEFKNIGAAIAGNLVGYATLSGAILGVANITKQSIAETVTYASEVRKLTQLTGKSADEMSRVIQVTDDYKVSTEALTTAQSTLAKDGQSLSVDTLARLSDDFRMLGSGAEKTAFLMKNFGRSGLQMAELMQQGGAKIKQAAEDMSLDLVFDEQKLQQARDYEKAMDSLGDSLQGLKYSVGGAAIPAITSFTNALATGAEAWKEIFGNVKYNQDVADRANYMERLARQSGEYSDWVKHDYMPAALAQKQIQDEEIERMERWPGYVEPVIDSLEDLGDVIKEANDTYNQQLNTIIDTTNAMADYDKKTTDLMVTQRGLQAEMNRLKSIKGSETLEYSKLQEELEDTNISYERQAEIIERMSQLESVDLSSTGMYKDLERELEEVNAALEANAETWEDNTNRAILAIMRLNAAKAESAGGELITDAEQAKIDNFMIATGQATEASIAYRDRIELLAEAQLKYNFTKYEYKKVMDEIMALPSDKEITLTTIMNMLMDLPSGSSSSDSPWSGEEGIGAEGGGPTPGADGSGATSSTDTSAPRRASGGSFRGWGIVGDSMTGLTQNTELVYAPHGAYVYNASQTRAILNRGGGRIPRYPTGGIIMSDPESPVIPQSDPAGYIPPSIYAEPGSVGGWSSGSISGGGTSDTIATVAASVNASVSTAAAVVAPVIEETKNIAHQTQLLAEQIAQSNKVQAMQSAQMLGELQFIRQLLTSQPKQFATAVQAII